MERKPLIKVEFTLTKKDGFDFDREKVAQLLCITPSRSSAPMLSKGTVRCNGDKSTADSIKGLTIIKEGEQPYPLIINAFLSIDFSIKTLSVEDAIDKMKEKLFGKEVLIVDICNKNNLFACVILRIYAQEQNLPEISLSKESIDYLSFMGACIDFDIQLQ